MATCLVDEHVHNSNYNRRKLIIVLSLTFIQLTELNLPVKLCLNIDGWLQSGRKIKLIWALASPSAFLNSYICKGYSSCYQLNRTILNRRGWVGLHNQVIAHFIDFPGWPVSSQSDYQMVQVRTAIVRVLSSHSFDQSLLKDSKDGVLFLFGDCPLFIWRGCRTVG